MKIIFATDIFKITLTKYIEHLQTDHNKNKIIIIIIIYFIIKSADFVGTLSYKN